MEFWMKSLFTLVVLMISGPVAEAVELNWDFGLYGGVMDQSESSCSGTACNSFKSKTSSNTLAFSIGGYANGPIVDVGAEIGAVRASFFLLGNIRKRLGNFNVGASAGIIQHSWEGNFRSLNNGETVGDAATAPVLGLFIGYRNLVLRVLEFDAELLYEDNSTSGQHLTAKVKSRIQSILFGYRVEF
jgi:hypothetical protein